MMSTVQFEVRVLYHRACCFSELISWTYSMKNFRAVSGGMRVR